MKHKTAEIIINKLLENGKSNCINPNIKYSETNKIWIRIAVRSFFIWLILCVYHHPEALPIQSAVSKNTSPESTHPKFEKGPLPPNLPFMQLLKLSSHGWNCNIVVDVESECIVSILSYFEHENNINEKMITEMIFLTLQINNIE